MSTNITREETAPGEESVWDYPRPPRLEDTRKHIEVVFNGLKIADTRRAKRVLETSHPPVYYIPAEDIRMEHLTRTQNHTYCEWKGGASYYTVTVDGKSAENAAWTYLDPSASFLSIKGYVAFYPSRMDECLVDGEKVRAQPGGFYGGWITVDIKGPFKGDSGTSGW